MQIISKCSVAGHPQNPALVQVVIMLVNGNLGTSAAVMGYVVYAIMITVIISLILLFLWKLRFGETIMERRI